MFNQIAQGKKARANTRNKPLVQEEASFPEKHKNTLVTQFLSCQGSLRSSIPESTILVFHVEQGHQETNRTYRMVGRQMHRLGAVATTTPMLMAVFPAHVPVDSCSLFCMVCFFFFFWNVIDTQLVSGVQSLSGEEQKLPTHPSRKDAWLATWSP